MERDPIDVAVNEELEEREYRAMEVDARALLILCRKNWRACGKHSAYEIISAAWPELTIRHATFVMDAETDADAETCLRSYLGS